MNLALAACLLASTLAQGAARFSMAPQPGDEPLLAQTAAAAGELLQGVASRRSGDRLVLEGQWDPTVAPERRTAVLGGLQKAWGSRFSWEEDPPRQAAPAAAKAAAATRHMDARALGSRLENIALPGSKSEQDAFYDRARTGSSGAEIAATARPAPSAAASTRKAPAPRLSTPPPPRASTVAGNAKVSWGRAGWEAVKGAGGVVKDVFTWKGLAIVAGSVALVTVAPVAIYPLLVLGAATGGWMIGKALVNGYKAHKAGNAEGVYAASRDFGRGALTVGLTLLGARHAPTNLKPHFPRTGGEWQAMTAAMDDEPIVVMSLLRGGEKR